MSKNISIFPRNFLRQPHIKELVPDVKLTLIALLIECESAVGCWIPASVDDAANIKHLGGAFEELERRSLISIDKKTGEFFLTEFFRMNHFVGAKRIGQARTAFAVIRSERLRREILEQISLNQRFCKLTPADLDDQDSAAPPPKKAPPKAPPVDNSDDAVNNQGVTIQGEGEGKGKGEGEGEDKEAAAPPAALSFFQKTEQLLKNGLRKSDGDHQSDKRRVERIIEFAVAAGEEVVLKVIKDCDYPFAALQLCEASAALLAAARSNDAGEKNRQKMLENAAAGVRRAMALKLAA